MNFPVVFPKSAEHDLKELKGYMIRNFGADAGQASYTKIKDAVKSIGTFPLGGDVPEELERLSLTQYRQVVAGMNPIIHDATGSRLYPHCVRHAERHEIAAHQTARAYRQNLTSRARRPTVPIRCTKGKSHGEPWLFQFWWVGRDSNSRPTD
ncbi:MAG: hypothetical protein RBS35_07105 [Azonexus sp.]|nr:hypothetical protein [Azonexus sp.]